MSADEVERHIEAHTAGVLSAAHPTASGLHPALELTVFGVVFALILAALRGGLRDYFGLDETGRPVPEPVVRAVKKSK